MSTLAPWFDPEVQPVHVGVYQVESCVWGRVLYAHWSGTAWGWWATTVQLASSKLYRKHQATNRGMWRGLVEKVQ